MIFRSDLNVDRMSEASEPIAGEEGRSAARPLSERLHGWVPSLDWRGEVNVGELERVLTGAGAVALGVYGYRRGGPLGMALAAVGGVLFYRALSGHCSAYRALGIDTAHAERAAAPEDYYRHGIHVEEAVVIHRPREELFRYWRNFENLPRFTHYLAEVSVSGPTYSHWVAKAPAGTRVEWDAEIINEIENELIAWRSLEGADVDNAGSVRFLQEPGQPGTEVHVVLDYIPPAGRAGAAVAKLFGKEPGSTVREDLRRFKGLMETKSGEPGSTHDPSEQAPNPSGSPRRTSA